MLNDIKQRWLEALRSGDYKQGRTFLKKQPISGDCTYCCLGVLCEIMELPQCNVDYHNRGLVFNFPDGTSSQTGLSNNFGEEIGITQQQQGKLMSLNDTERKSFSEIADWIDENL